MQVLAALLLHVDTDLRQVLDLDREGRIQDRQLLRVLDQVSHLAILLLQLLDLQVAFENLSLCSLLLALETGLKLVLCVDPLVEIASQIAEVPHLFVDGIRLFDGFERSLFLLSCAPWPVRILQGALGGRWPQICYLLGLDAFLG